MAVYAVPNGPGATLFGSPGKETPLALVRVKRDEILRLLLVLNSAVHLPPTHRIVFPQRQVPFLCLKHPAFY